MNENGVVDAAAQARIEELRTHMEEAGEPAEGAPDDERLGASLVFEQKMKLVRMPGADALYAVPSSQDWAHDALGETSSVSGTFYVEGDPFPEGAAMLTGYFQADEDGRWVRVADGAAAFAPGADEAEWRERLEDFPEVMSQLSACMETSEYRHLAEQAALKSIMQAETE